MSASRQIGGGLRIGRIRYSAVHLLVALALLFVVTPFVESMPFGNVIELALFTIVLISGALAIGARGRSLWIGGLLCTGAVAVKWTQHVLPHVLPVWAQPVSALLFLIYLFVQLLRFVLRASRVNSEVLCAAISAYLLLGLIWSLNYAFVARVTPDAFVFSVGPESSRTMDRFNAFYFSFVVLSTVGFGDITPVSKVARMLAVTEAITGLFYVTVLISRLVAMYVPGGDREAPPPDHPS
jgi:hypothetical protein